MSNLFNKNVLPSCLADRTNDVNAHTEYFYGESCTAIRKLLVEEFEARIRRSQDKSESTERYKEPNWQEYQADQVGYRRAFKEIIYLLRDKSYDQ